MTLALTAPDLTPAWTEAFAGGLMEAAGSESVTLVGGDTTRGPELVITVQIIGEVAEGGALRRSGAQPGDRVYVTGTPGDAAGGLAILLTGEPGSEAEKAICSRFLRPTARIGAGQAVAGTATAAIDVSDGLIADIGKLAAASGVAAVIDVDAIPISPELLASKGPQTALEFALGGGDDFELCITALPGSLPETIGAVALTPIGVIEAGEGVRCVCDGLPFDCDQRGYTHFQ